MSDNSRILDLPPVTANASGDVFPLVQNGVTQKTTLSKIKTFFDGIYTTTSAVAAQISSALTNYVTNSSLASTLTNYATTTALSNGLALKQNEYDLGNAETGTNLVTISELSGVATFTDILQKKTSAYYEIENALVVNGVTKVEYGLNYTGAGYPVIMHYKVENDKIRFHIANIAVDGGAGIDTNANLVVTFRII